MAEVKNAFLKSKMNKDLDARLLPSGEYRDAQNAQISRSEGDDVGALTNVLGNKLLVQFNVFQNNMTSIGYYVDETNNDIYVFLTDNFTSNWVPGPVSGLLRHSIWKYNVKTEVKTKLVEGAFLNFSTHFPIVAVNLLEDMLFWTDNRNQPRKINVAKASANSSYYTNEDQISVAKYNPFQAIELYETAKVDPASALGDYQCSMKDVTSKFLPGGGTAIVDVTNTGTTFQLNSLNIPFYPNAQTAASPNVAQAGMTVGLVSASGTIGDTDNPVVSGGPTSVTLTGSQTFTAGDELVFNFNPYYDPDYVGDDDFLEDKFVRFSYRFEFDDGEYSLIAPFTQECFIPKQDGYFLNQSQSGTAATDGVGDQQLAFSSTVVEFMENKVNQIKLNIPLPSTGDNFVDDFKIKNVEIIYKQSDETSLKVVETIPADDIASLAGSTYILPYTYSGQLPFKTLPQKDLIRVYDKIPVKALSQEIISNRVVYGNFQDKHTPPAFLDYNVIATEKSAFDLKNGTGYVTTRLDDDTSIDIKVATGTIAVGSVMTGGTITEETVVTSTTGGLSPTITVTNGVTQTTDTTYDFTLEEEIEQTTSIIEYPNHSLKTNRNYQVGVVLSDRYGRTSSVILSENEDTITVGSDTFKGDSIYSPYIDEDVDVITWPGNSLKMSFNSVIGPAAANPATGWPGLYNGDTTSEDYNPLGWYSFKIVVKQQEQEYYNVYTAGAMKGLPYNYDNEASTPTLNINTSFLSLINDNINKVPRDLSEVGPQDKTFRSSVRLFGRVENNTNGFSNVGNDQYFPNEFNFTTNVIEDLFDIFDVANYVNQVNTSISITSSENPFHPFFKSDSNPFIAEFVTSNDTDFQFGIINPSLSTNAGTAQVNGNQSNVTVIPLNTFTGDPPKNGDAVSGTGITTDTFVISYDPSTNNITVNKNQVSLSNGTVLTFSRTTFDDIENLTILETEPTVSRLDIYYETSTSGLISDLNTIILNSNNSAANIDSFDTSTFTEALNSGENILASNFFLIDNFSATIPTGDITSALKIVSCFNRQSPTPLKVAGEGLLDVSSAYFTLVGDNTTGYNIQTTTAFLEKVFYGSDQAAREFDFTLQVGVNDSTTNISREALLINIAPTMTAPAGGSGNAPYTVVASITDANPVTEMTAINGAYNPDNLNEGRDIDWIIGSQTNSSGENVGPRSSDPLNYPYFGLQFSYDSATDTSTCSVNNLRGSSLPPDTYNLKVNCTDAGGTGEQDQVIITLQYGTTVVNVFQRDFSAFRTVGGVLVEDIFPAVILQINDGDHPGFYVYDGSWNNLTQFGNSNVVITFSQVVQNQNTCGSWYYDTNSQGTAIALFTSCLQTQGYSSISAQGADIDYSAESVLYTVI
jgi:hypothetical protein